MINWLHSNDIVDIANMADIIIKINVLNTIDKAILQFNVSWLKLQRAILLKTL